MKTRIEKWDDDHEEIVYIDDIGGEHSEGLGWNPDGIFCGECNNMDCSTCDAWKIKHKPNFKNHTGDDYKRM